MIGSAINPARPKPLSCKAAKAGPLLFILSPVVFLAVTAAQARMETPEEIERILTVLGTENCEIIRDAMGEKKLSIKGENFVVEATCADEKPYSLTLDQNFEVIDRKAIDH